eukprot:501099-Rhodomonas_salina.5
MSVSGVHAGLWVEQLTCPTTKPARVVDVRTLGLHSCTYLLERADCLRRDDPYLVVILQHADLLGPAPPARVSDGLECMAGTRVACLPSTSLQSRLSTSSSTYG